MLLLGFSAPVVLNSNNREEVNPNNPLNNAE